MDDNYSFLPYQELKKRVNLPVELYEFQQRAANELGPLPRLGLYFDVGTGKTFTAIVIAMYKLLFSSIEKTVVIMPPVLLQNWRRNIEKFPGTDVLIYAGTPAQRKKLTFDKQFILVGLQMFKRDIKRFEAELGNCRLFIIVDEAQVLKNPGSDNFKFVRDFSLINDLCLLTGTPLSVPEDGYAYIKLLTPDVYKSQYQFESIHVAERDFRTNKPKEYAHLDMLNKNLLLAAHRVLKEDVLKDLPELTYTPIYYDLEPEHLKLYNRMVDEQMVKLTNGGKIDLTNVSALYQALQQVPCSAEYFSEGRVRSTVYDLIDAVMDELAGKKLVIFCHYRRTTTQLLEYLKDLGAVALWGDTKDRQAPIDTFVKDPKCKIIILQIQAASAGIDGLQDVCQDMLFVEMPYRAATFHQAIARLHRDGQKSGVNCRVAIAQKTLQMRVWEFLQENDSLVNIVLRGSKDIRDSLEGR
jgi:SNF2 family DNA or RNA helicase